jgi:hypothetical protein
LQTVIERLRDEKERLTIELLEARLKEIERGPSEVCTEVVQALSTKLQRVVDTLEQAQLRGREQPRTRPADTDSTRKRLRVFPSDTSSSSRTVIETHEVQDLEEDPTQSVLAPHADKRARLHGKDSGSIQWLNKLQPLEAGTEVSCTVALEALDRAQAHAATFNRTTISDITSAYLFLLSTAVSLHTFLREQRAKRESEEFESIDDLRTVTREYYGVASVHATFDEFVSAQQQKNEPIRKFAFRLKRLAQLATKSPMESCVWQCLPKG